MIKVLLKIWRRLFGKKPQEVKPEERARKAVEPVKTSRGHNKLGRRLGRRMKRKARRDLRKVVNHGRGAKK